MTHTPAPEPSEHPQIIASDLRDVSWLGRALRQRRRALGFTQAECAEMAGVSAGWLSRFENGKDTAQIGMIMDVAEVLGAALCLQATEPDPFDEAPAPGGEAP